MGSQVSTPTRRAIARGRRQFIGERHGEMDPPENCERQIWWGTHCCGEGTSPNGPSAHAHRIQSADRTTNLLWTGDECELRSAGACAVESFGRVRAGCGDAREYGAE